MPNTDSAFIQDYMNNIPEEYFPNLVRKNFMAAWRTAQKAPVDFHEKKRNLSSLLKIKDSPKPRYILPDDDGLGRIATGSPLPRLNISVKQALTPTWNEVDLAQTQLAICARNWNIESLLEFLEGGSLIWDSLYAHLEIPADQAAEIKTFLKRALYATCFGKPLDRVASLLSKQLRNLRLRDVGVAFTEHSLIQDLAAASDRELKKIIANGGATGYYGEWHTLGDKKPGRLLAQIAQSWESKLILPVYKLAAQTDEFLIVLYQYDGVKIDFLKNAEENKIKITNAITQVVIERNIPTRPRWKV